MKRAIGKLLSALCLLPALAAPLMIFGRMVLPDALWQWLLWPLLAVTLAALAGAFPSRLRFWAALVGVLLFAGCAYLWLARGLALLYLLPCAILYLLVLLRFAVPPFEEWPISLLITGFCLYPVAIFMARAQGWEALQPILRTVWLGYIPILLLYINQGTLVRTVSARDGSAPPGRIRRGNRLLAIGLAIAVLILANLRAIRDAFYAAGTWLLDIIGRAVAWLMSLLASTPVEEGVGPGGGDQMMLPGAGDQEPFLLWKILEKVAMVVAAVLLTALVIFALIKLAKWLRRISARLLARLREAAQQLGEGVQDRTESIFDVEEIREDMKKRLESVRDRLRRPPRWQSLDSRGRVRRLYAQWIGRHGTPGSVTAREALSRMDEKGSAADIYERARYSELPVDEADVEALREALRREG